MARNEMLIVKKAYDFSKWLLQHTGKFPKSYRFSVAVRIENTMLEFTELGRMLGGWTGHARQASTRKLRQALGVSSSV